MPSTACCMQIEIEPHCGQMEIIISHNLARTKTTTTMTATKTKSTERQLRCKCAVVVRAKQWRQAAVSSGVALIIMCRIVSRRPLIRSVH